MTEKIKSRPSKFDKCFPSSFHQSTYPILPYLLTYPILPYLPNYLPIHPTTTYIPYHYLPTFHYLPTTTHRTQPATYPPACLAIYLPNNLPTCTPTHLPTLSIPTHPPTYHFLHILPLPYLPTYQYLPTQPTNLPTYPSIT